MTNLKEIIYKRKSIRKYDMTPLEKNTIEGIRKFLAEIKPLYDNIKVEYEITEGENVRGLFAIKAPHYLIISSEAKEGYLPNAGFLLQQMDLYLQSMGLGSCWLGGAKPPAKSNLPLNFVILLAFGKPQGNPHRSPSEFNRKPLNEISDTTDKRLEPARLAPSAINSQPWYFINEGNAFHVYRVKYGAIKNFIYDRMNQIDIGIALSHLYVEYSDTFRFFTADNPRQLKNHEYIGSVEI